MHEVFNRCHEAAESPVRLSSESFALHLLNGSSDLHHGLSIVELDGQIVGFAKVEAAESSHGPGTYTSACYLLTEARGRGLGEAMLSATELRIRELAQTRGRAAVRIHAEPFDTDTGAHELLIAAGYRPVRRFATMIRPELSGIPDAPLPKGVELRAVAEADLRAIWEADVEAFRDHWIGRDDSEEAYQRFLADPLNDVTLWRVAWQGDQVAGQVRSFINSYENERCRVRRGWTENISVRKAWRRLGLARALLVDSMRGLLERGMTTAALGADTESGAFSLYRQLGFEPVCGTTVFEKRLA